MFSDSEKFRLISDNGGILKRATVRLSTLRIPPYLMQSMPDAPQYETCVFVYGLKSFGIKTSCEVLDQYYTSLDAVLGHCQLAAQYGLTNHNY